MKVLVFGGNGMLGHVVVEHLTEVGHNVTFTVRNKVPDWMPFRVPVGVVKFELKDNIPSLEGYDWVINCLGLIKQKQDVKPGDFYEANAVFPWRLSLACKAAGVKMIHVSSDCVFSGKGKGLYSPGDVKDAEDDYGKSKAMGEPEHAITIRTSIIGPSSESKLGLYEWFFNHEPGRVPGYTNHTWSGVTTLFLAQFIEKIITSDVSETSGLIQLATDPITKYTLLELLKDVHELSLKFIDKVEAKETINRGMVSTVKTVPDIHAQLVDLRRWSMMKR